ncbi:MAG: hypothetical protein ABI624_18565, partial [Casimicrobiaceae bacterium]
ARVRSCGSTPRPASLTLSGSRDYDGSTAVAGSVLIANGVAGQTFSVTGAGAIGNLASKNVQTGGTLASLTGLALGTSTNGGLVSNYNVLGTAGSAVSITQLPSVAWTSLSPGNWANPAHWAGGALPDGNNVAAVTIPVGASVTYSNAVGATQLTSLTSLGNLSVTGGSLTLGNVLTDQSTVSGATLNLSGGQLTVNGSLQADVLRVGGGTLNGSGNLASPDFAQTGGSIAPSLSNLVLASLGDFNLMSPLGATQSIALSSGGAIVDALSAGTAPSVSAPSVHLNAATGIGSAAAPLRLSTTALSAATATGPIQLYNAPVGSVLLASLVTGDASDITYDQEGQALVVGTVSSQGGKILIDPPTDVTLNGAVSTTGSITIEALNNLVMAPGATVNSGGGNVVLNAGGNIALASVNAGTGNMLIQTSGGQIGTVIPGFNNATAFDLTLDAQTGIQLAYIASALHVSNVSGLILLTDSLTGLTLSNQAPPTDTSLSQIVATVIQQTVQPTGQTNADEKPGDKKEEVPADKPATETFVVGNTLVEKPADEIVRFDKLKGRTLMCRARK